MSHDNYIADIAVIGIHDEDTWFKIVFCLSVLLFFVMCTNHILSFSNRGPSPLPPCKQCFFGIFFPISLISNLEMHVLINILNGSIPGFLTDDLVTAEDNGNQKKYLGVCKLPGEGRRVDFSYIVV